jgi:hypothetical protein
VSNPAIWQDGSIGSRNGNKGAAHGNTAEKCGQDDSKRIALAPNHISKNSRPVNLRRKGGKSGKKKNSQGRCLYLALIIKCQQKFKKNKF